MTGQALQRKCGGYLCTSVIVRGKQNKNYKCLKVMSKIIKILAGGINN